ncbi:hypothetical protein As57867_002171, partial [Aphanomyces stellatus]
WSLYLRRLLGQVVDEPSVVVVDNFDAHVNEESFKIVQEELGSHLCALPPNATGVCQPLDVGIMAPFKRHLRDLWLLEDEIQGPEDEQDIESPTACEKRRVMILRAIKAWDLITASQIVDSFKKAIPTISI